MSLAEVGRILKWILHASITIPFYCGTDEAKHPAEMDRSYLGAAENGRRNISLHTMWQLAAGLRVAPRSQTQEALAPEPPSTPSLRRAVGQTRRP
jgi:transcriptional regulator with XRE-family HTH domain